MSLIENEDSQPIVQPSIGDTKDSKRQGHKKTGSGLAFFHFELR